MSNFFSTKEFIFMQKLSQRLEELNTENNLEKYKEHLKNCKALALSDYKNIGWREDLGKYAWEPDMGRFGPIMLCLGDEKDLGVVPGYETFISKDMTMMTLKAIDGSIIRFSKFEMTQLKKCSLSELRKIAKAKELMKGEILDAAKERNPFSEKNKGLS